MNTFSKKIICFLKKLVNKNENFENNENSNKAMTSRIISLNGEFIDRTDSRNSTLSTFTIPISNTQITIDNSWDFTNPYGILFPIVDVPSIGKTALPARVADIDGDILCAQIFQPSSRDVLNVQRAYNLPTSNPFEDFFIHNITPDHDGNYGFYTTTKITDSYVRQVNSSDPTTDDVCIVAPGHDFEVNDRFYISRPYSLDGFDPNNNTVYRPDVANYSAGKFTYNRTDSSNGAYIYRFEADGATPRFTASTNVLTRPLEDIWQKNLLVHVYAINGTATQVNLYGLTLETDGTNYEISVRVSPGDNEPPVWNGWNKSSGGSFPSPRTGTASNPLFTVYTRPSIPIVQNLYYNPTESIPIERDVLYNVELLNVVTPRIEEILKDSPFLYVTLSSGANEDNTVENVVATNDFFGQNASFIVGLQDAVVVGSNKLRLTPLSGLSQLVKFTNNDELTVIISAQNEVGEQYDFGDVFLPPAPSMNGGAFSFTFRLTPV
jgi:hypothetical protein